MASDGAARHVHGDKGVYYAGCWTDMEDLGQAWCPPAQAFSGDARRPPPPPASAGYDCDVAVIGAGCVGASIARELSRFALRVVLIEASDDVTQGATKGNSGIVHAGYDDAPGSTRARLCWKGNQMFTQLDRELRFGLQRNGSLVVARNAEDEATLRELLERGRTNGVRNLRIVGRDELRAMEPLIAPDATAALFSPDAATLTPYEFAIALAENAVDNGVELRLNSRVVGLAPLPGGGFAVTTAGGGGGGVGGGVGRGAGTRALITAVGPLLVVAVAAAAAALSPGAAGAASDAAVGAGVPPAAAAYAPLAVISLAALVAAAAGALVGGGRAAGAASPPPPRVTRARFAVNAAGLGAGDVARLAGDASFYIKPRVGEARHILFPAPGKMGKGVLVQTTLWGNLILGPTAADVADPATATRTPADIMRTIIARCRDLVPSFDAGAVIHSFSGQRAKSSRGDWIIERCATAPDLVHAAGIDSPGLAGSPAIALEVVALLRAAGMPAAPNPSFNPQRKPIIVPKDHARWAAAAIEPDGTVSTRRIKLDSAPPACNVVCKCEKVTESEIVDACHRSLPCASTQAVRKRTRAGMGHCQAEYCEERVKAIVARETRAAGGVASVPGRPWPATSILPARWLEDEARAEIAALA